MTTDVSRVLTSFRDRVDAPGNLIFTPFAKRLASCRKVAHFSVDRSGVMTRYGRFVAARERSANRLETVGPRSGFSHTSWVDRGRRLRLGARDAG